MTFRITKKDLRDRLERLNQISKRKYRFSWAYSKVQLVSMYDENTGAIESVSYLCTKPELYEQIHLIFKYLEMEGKVK